MHALWILLMSVVCVASQNCSFPDNLRGTWVWETGQQQQNFIVFNESEFGPYDGNQYACYSYVGNNTYIARTESYNYNCFQFLAMSKTIYLMRSLTTKASMTPRPTGDVSDNSVCDITQPDPSDFTVLVKSVTDDTQLDYIECPVEFLGKFNYTVIDGYNKKQCGANSLLDGCTNKHNLFFDYDKCARRIAKSMTGMVSCIASWEGKAGMKFLYVRSRMDSKDNGAGSSTMTNDSWNRVTCFTYAPEPNTGTLQVALTMACKAALNFNISNTQGDRLLLTQKEFCSGSSTLAVFTSFFLTIATAIIFNVIY